MNMYLSLNNQINVIKRFTLTSVICFDILIHFSTIYKIDKEFLRCIFITIPLKIYTLHPLLFLSDSDTAWRKVFQTGK